MNSRHSTPRNAAAKTAMPIAIVGLAGRFPGANNVEELWTNFARGRETISVLTQEEMRSAGIPEAISRLPGYVNAAALLDGVDRFDAQFFGFSARDAALTDPQHRLFLETAWQALEDAGYDPSRFPGAIGVFGGCELSSYLGHLYQHSDSLKYIDGMQLMVSNDKDHLCTQVSYRLNLRGPSVVVQTTCSTSLVAVALACESLERGRCDMALAGGVTVKVPQKGGYFYSPGSILSPDGHCRPFDARAQGTIVGSGVGLVVLKRLDDALAARDHIRAVILGVGINNDGNDKVGYTAPSARGQAGAIRAAHRSAGVTPESISYVEAHGTGTILGDPIELSALTEVFREATSRRGFCGIGSAKSNFGHLSCAAGVTGLIKTVLALENEAIPPTVHYAAPNPAIDLAASPFYVATNLLPWARNGTPRRAGVSSFGVGGTNAHAILEEAPPRAVRASRRSHHLFALSARSEAALDQAWRELAAHLAAHPETSLADAAYTLQIGRQFFKYRRALVVDAERGRALEALQGGSHLPAITAATDRPAVLMFPGQGSQYPGMAAGLYKTEPVARRAIDRCARVLEPVLKADLRKVLFAAGRDSQRAEETLKDTRWAQPALFVVGYALAELWSSWGVKPAAMIGHSVGEYVAATLAGVMSLEDALLVIAERGRLISKLPGGSMLAVMGSPAELERFVTGKISVAAVNAPRFTVLSGSTGEVARLETKLAKEGIAGRRLHTSHAFHSPMMEPILAKFEKTVSRIALSPPERPFVSTFTGEWAGENVTRPEYWSGQLRHPVRFADGLRTLLARPGLPAKAVALIEAGPGSTLSTFVRNILEEPPLCLLSLRGPGGQQSDTEQILGALGQFWAAGGEVDWDAVHRPEPRARVSLPTYPFERQSYWVGASPSPVAAEVRDPFNWFYRPAWRETALGAASPAALAGRRILVLDRATSPGAAIVQELLRAGCEVLIARPGEGFARRSEHECVLDPDREEDWAALAGWACEGETRLAGVIDCWSAEALQEEETTSAGLQAAALMSLLAPMRLTAALSKRQTLRPLPILFVAAGTTRVDASDRMSPTRALGGGVARVLPQEHPGVRVAHLDVDDTESVPAMVLAELAAGAPQMAVAFRRGKRLVEKFEAAPLRSAKAPADLPANPVVLITGGLGYMGMYLAEALFRRCGARLALLGRAPLPPPEQWADKAAEAGTAPHEKVLLQRLVKMRAERDDIAFFSADMNRQSDVQAAVEAAIAHFGSVDMVVHGAARIDPAAFGSIAETNWDVVQAQFYPKLHGLLYLMEALRGREPKRWILHSSIAAVLGGLALGAYAGANAMLDALAVQHGPHWLSIAWDAWDNAAEAESAGMPSAIKPDEGKEVLVRLLGHWNSPRAVVAINLAERLKAWVDRADPAPAAKKGMERHERPSLATAFVEPRTDTERALVDIWGAQLGIAAIGIHDRFFDLGGHSLLAAQIASEICDRFQIELPVLKLFQAPTVGELAVLVDQARAGGGPAQTLVRAAGPDAASLTETELQGNAPEIAAKESYRNFYNDVTRRLEQSGMGAASFFLNYGYVSVGEGDEAAMQIPAEVFNRNSVRLVCELVGATPLKGLRVLDVGCGRGGTVAFLAEQFAAVATGVDLSPEAIAFCRATHGSGPRFETGDAEHLPLDDASYDVVTNIESSHTYPNLRAFFTEVQRVLVAGGIFLYTDLLPVARWDEVRMLLASLGLHTETDRDITASVLLSCDEVAGHRTQAFGGSDEMIDNFLAVPGSVVYEQMHSGAWEYRILRARRRT